MANVPALVQQTAAQYGVSPQLALAVAQEESGLNQNAVSPAGAIGVMQLMPATAASIGVNPYDLADNIKGGILYLRDQLNHFGDVAMAVAAYNWGPSAVAQAVARYGAAWLGYAPAETQAYVAKIAGVTPQANPAIQTLPDSSQAYMTADDSAASPATTAFPWLALGFAGLALWWLYED